jgi:hypothetical protein
MPSAAIMAISLACEPRSAKEKEFSQPPPWLISVVSETVLKKLL